MFQHSLAERTVPVPRSVPGKTVPTVPVPVRFLSHPEILLSRNFVVIAHAPKRCIDIPRLARKNL